MRRILELGPKENPLQLRNLQKKGRLSELPLMPEETYVGVDRNSELIHSEIWKKIKQDHGENANFLIGNSDRLPVVSMSQDEIVALGIQFSLETLQEIDRVLKSGGLFYFGLGKTSNEIRNAVINFFDSKNYQLLTQKTQEYTYFEPKTGESIDYVVICLQKNTDN